MLQHLGAVKFKNQCSFALLERVRQPAIVLSEDAQQELQSAMKHWSLQIPGVIQMFINLGTAVSSVNRRQAVKGKGKGNGKQKGKSAGKGMGEQKENEKAKGWEGHGSGGWEGHWGWGEHWGWEDHWQC